MRFSAVNQKCFIAVGAGAAWGTQHKKRNTSLMQPPSQDQRRRLETPETGPRVAFLPAMQQNPPSPYPEVFWTNSSAVLSPNCVPLGLYPTGARPGPPRDTCPPWPVPARRKQRLDTSTCLCFLVVFLLIFLALLGVGLAMFQIFHLQKELEVTSLYTGTGKSSWRCFGCSLLPGGEVVISRAPKAFLDMYLGSRRIFIQDGTGAMLCFPIYECMPLTSTALLRWSHASASRDAQR